MSWRRRALGIGGVVLAAAAGYRRKRSAHDLHEPPPSTRRPLAELFDRITTPAMTEWFSLFYFAYFPLIGAHVFLFMFRARRRHVLAEFSFGIVWLFCVAHVAYLAVPGHGPHAFLGEQFVHRLEGETFWPLVRATVVSVESSARTDIFPSLHTAGPTFLAAFAFAHRRESPFRWLCIPLAFVASQIALATMFLRWHYLLDVCAGLVHGILAARFARAVSGWERRWRRASGSMPVWTTPW